MGRRGMEKDKEREYVSRHDRQKLWLRIVGLFAVAVLCGTIYALILPAIASASGVDVTNSIQEVTLYQDNGTVWEVTSSFTTDDNAKVKLTFSFPTSTLNGGDLVYINLADYISIPEEMEGEEYAIKLYDSEYPSGHSAIYYLKDGKAYIQFTEAYLTFLKDNNKTVIDGDISFEFQWNEDKLEGGYNTITDFFGKYDGTVYIYKEEEEEDNEGSGGTEGDSYYISKGAAITADRDPDSTDGYIEYTLNLTLNKDMEGPINLEDSLTYAGTGIEYVMDSFSAYFEWNSANWVNVAATKNGNNGVAITLGDAGQTLSKGTYTIKYKVKVPGLYTPDYSGSDIGNKVRVNIDEEKRTATSWVSTSRSKVSKYGVDAKDGKVDWTVYINAGSVRADMSGVTFTDTLPTNGTVDRNSIKIEQTDANWQTTTWTLDQFLTEYSGSSFDEQTGVITLTLPDGQYSYKITYTTTTNLNGTEDGDYVEVKNGYHLDGFGGTADGTESVWIQKDNIQKSLSATGGYQTVDGKWVVPLSYTLTIKQIETNVIYCDYAVNSGSGGEYTGSNQSLYYMTEEQFNGIQVIYADGTPVDTSAYKIDHYIPSNTASQTGLFQIEFNRQINGPVYINYTVYADMTCVREDQWAAFTNHFKAGNRDISVSTYLQNKKSSGWVYKYTAGGNAGDFSSDYESGITDAIDWVIEVNGKHNLKGDLTITDTVPAGLKVDKDSIALYLDQAGASPWSDNSIQSSLYQVEITDNEDGTQTMTVTVDGKAYDPWGIEWTNVFYILYTTKITDENFLKSNDKIISFQNTVKVETDDGQTDEMTHEVTVTRSVVGKNGSFDPSTNTLDYEVVVNPDGADLLSDGSGGQLCVTDTLPSIPGALQGNLELIGVSLFTATTDMEGDIIAGQHVGDLVRTDSEWTAKSQNDQYYMYKDNGSSCTITTYLSDNKPHVLVYSYLVTTDEISTSIAVVNKATVEGNGVLIDSADDSTKVLRYQMSGSLSASDNTVSIVIRKHDEEQYSKLLEGATYKLMKYENGQWVEVGTYTTDADSGTKWIQGLSYNMLYRLEEITPPNGYLLDEEPYYFAFKMYTWGYVPYPYDVPYNEINWYDQTYVFVERYDMPDDSYDPDDSKTSITVEKNWLAADGSEAAAGLSSIYFDLYRVAAGSETLNGTEWWHSDNTESTRYTIKDGDTIQFTIKYQNKVTAPNVTLEISDGVVWIDSNLGEQTNAWLFPSDVKAEVYTNTSMSDVANSIQNQAYTLEKGHKYTATVTRNGNLFTIVYKDETAGEDLYTVTMQPDITMKEDATVKIKAQRGLYSVSAVALDENGKETDDIEIAEGEYYGTYKISAANNWTLTINDLPAAVAGTNGATLCSYYVVEKEIEGYITTYSENNTKGITSGTLTITNTSEEPEPEPPEETDITVKKDWSSVDNEAMNAPTDGNITFDLYKQTTVTKSGGTVAKKPATLTYTVRSRQNEYSDWRTEESHTIEGAVGDVITFTYWRKYADQSPTWAGYLTPVVKYNGVEQQSEMIKWGGTYPEIEKYTVILTGMNDELIFEQTGADNSTIGQYTLDWEADLSAPSTSVNPDRDLTVENGKTYVGTGWWPEFLVGQNRTEDVVLGDGTTVNYTFRYDEVVQGANLTFEVTDGVIWLESNFGALWNDAFVNFDSSDPLIISDYNSFSLVKGHVYQASVSRNGNIFTFAYYDLTDDEACYRTSIIPASTIGAAKIHVLAQFGTFTIGEGIIDSESAISDTSGVEKIDSYTISAADGWQHKFTDLPAREVKTGTDENGNQVTLTFTYNYYVVETGINLDGYSEWEGYDNNGANGANGNKTITIKNKIGYESEDVKTELTVEKKWLASNGNEIVDLKDLEGITVKLYRVANPARQWTSFDDNFGVDTRTQEYDLEEGSTVQFTMLYNGFTSTTKIDPYVTLEVRDKDSKFVDSNFGCFGNAWTANDGDPQVWSTTRPDDFSLVKGHMYTISVTREISTKYIFVYYDLTEGKECYTTTVDTYASYEDAVVYLIVQRGTYTVSGKILGSETEEGYSEVEFRDKTLAASINPNGSWPYEKIGEEGEIVLPHEGSVQFRMQYEGDSEKLGDFKSGVTLEIRDSKKRYVDSNMGLDGNSWTYWEDGEEWASGSSTYNPYNPYLLIPGHVYKATITRNAREYTFVYFDETANQECYRTVITTVDDYADTVAYIIAQQGDYIISGKTLGKETLVETYELSTENDWKKTYPDLPAQGVDDAGNPVIYTYYVEEVGGPSDYTVTYGTSESDDAFSTASRAQASSGTITITNKKDTPDDSGYELPKTGGSGTANWYTFGAMLTAAALALLMYRRRLCRKGAENLP